MDRLSSFKQMDSQIDRQTDGQENRQAEDRQVDRQMTKWMIGLWRTADGQRNRWMHICYRQIGS